MSADAVEQIFAGLVADRGGMANFDRTQLQICRRVAVMLADDGDLSASALSALLALLPAKPSDSEPEYDFSKLSDKEFATLDHLTAVAAGLKPPGPQPKPRRAPQRSYRQIWGEIYAIDVDQIEAEQENARRCKRPWALSDDDRIAIANACQVFLGLLAKPETVWPHIEETATHNERKKWLDKQSVAVPAAAVLDAPAADPAATPVAPGAVVPLFGAFIGKRHIPGESSRSEARTDDLPRGGRW
jgi:hypothetical protein